MAKANREAASGAGEAQEPVELDSVWVPQPGPQLDAITADWCPIMFYGGGKFSGKSDFLLGDYLQDLEVYREHWQGIIFRRSLTEFTELKLRAAELFPQIGGVWREQKSQWEFPRYGRQEGDTLLQPILRFRYLENLRDIRLYEGHSYPWIGVDELGDWEDPDAFFRLITCNRYGRYPIPNKRIRATGNPGGRGHTWIKKYFVDPAPLGSKLLFDPILEMNYMFILGTYRDNKIGLQNDPGYEKRLNRAGSPELVKALKEGDFSIVAGAFYPQFGHDHIIEPFHIPSYWTRFLAMDYGACGEGDPFALGWFAVSDGSIAPYPKGALIMYREWYGGDLPKINVSDIAEGIKARETLDPTISYRVAGHDLEKNIGTGPSAMELFRDFGIYFKHADMRRKQGWLQLGQLLSGKNQGPLIYFYKTCINTIEAIPALQHDPKDALDVLQSFDDIPDMVRYGVMSRPWVDEEHKPTPTPQGKALYQVTYNELLKGHFNAVRERT